MQYEKRGRKETLDGILWTTHATAREFGIKTPTLVQWIEKGWFPAPTVTVGKRCYYRGSDIPELRRKAKRTVARNAARKEGWSVQGLAAEIGVTRVVFQHHLKYGNIPSPNPETKRYSGKEAQAIKQYFDRRNAIKKSHYNLLPGLVKVGCSEVETYWATNPQNKPQLILGIASVRLGSGQKDTWYSVESLVQIRERIRLRRTS